MNKKGFTLVELLVVIAILGLLAMIAIPRLGAYRRDAAIAANQASAASIYNGAQAYVAKHGNLTGFDHADYITGAMPSDAVVSAVTMDSNGDVSAVSVTTNGDWVGIHPPDGTTGGPGGQVMIDVTLPRFEAEAATRFGGATVQPSGSASGGQVIGNLNNTGDGVEIMVNTTDVVAGDATLVIRYSCAFNPPGKFGLYINGIRVKQITFTNTGSWHTFTSATESITLDHTVASNTIRLYRDAQDGPAIDIDYFDLTVKKYQ